MKLWYLNTMQYLQVLRKFKYFYNVAIMPIKQICCTVVVGKLLYFVQKIELLYFLLYQTVCMTVMVICKNWPHVFLVINEYNDLWTAESWCSSIYESI